MRCLLYFFYYKITNSCIFYFCQNISKYLDECLRFERLIFGRVKLSHIKGKKRDMLREFYMLYLHISISDIIHLQNACCF